MSNAFVVHMTITLDNVTPATRMIEVPLGIRLDRLHTTFQEALGWTDSHLWELTFGGARASASLTRPTALAAHLMPERRP